MYIHINVARKTRYRERCVLFSFEKFAVRGSKVCVYV